MSQLKVCSTCKLEKPVDTFLRDLRREGSYRAKCKLCVAARDRAYRAANRDKVREQLRQSYKNHRDKRIEYSRQYRIANLEKVKGNYQRWYAANRSKRQKDRLQRLYGLTQEELDKLKDAQAGLCGICGKEGRLVVDHDHVTGKVRGLLHSLCNQGLGKLGDSREGLLAALAYLKKSDLTNNLKHAIMPPPVRHES
jgi:hypothetical protein